VHKVWHEVWDVQGCGIGLLIMTLGGALAIIAAGIYHGARWLLVHFFGPVQGIRFGNLFLAGLASGFLVVILVSLVVSAARRLRQVVAKCHNERDRGCKE